MLDSEQLPMEVSSGPRYPDEGKLAELGDDVFDFVDVLSDSQPWDKKVPHITAAPIAS